MPRPRQNSQAHQNIHLLVRTVHLMNQGYIGSEISEMIQLPQEIEQNWSTRC